MAVNAKNWADMQQGLRKVKAKLSTPSPPPYVPNKHGHPYRVVINPDRQSPRLHRFFDDDYEGNDSANTTSSRPGSGDLRRDKYRVVPPLGRSHSLEAAGKHPPTSEDSIPSPLPSPSLTPTMYSKDVPEPFFTKRFERQPNKISHSKKSISSYLQSRDYSKALSNDDLTYEKLAHPSQAARFKHRKLFPDSISDHEDLAPTPDFRFEHGRNVVTDPTNRHSLDAVLSKYKTHPRGAGTNDMPSSKPYRPKAHRKRRPEHLNLRVGLARHTDEISMCVESLVDSALEEELVPDLLIDTLLEMRSNAATSDDTDVTLDGLARDPRHLRRADRMRFSDELNTSQSPQLYTNDNHPIPVSSHRRDSLSDSVTDIMDFILHETIQEETQSALNDAYDTLQPVAILTSFEVMEYSIDLVLQLTLPDLVREAVFEVILEDLIDQELIPEIIERDTQIIAIETLQKLDNRVESKQRRVVNNFAKEKLLDSFTLEHLMNLIAKSGRIFTDAEYSDKMLDSLILDQLLGQYLEVRSNLNYTVRNRPLRRLHEKLVTDVILDVLLTELDGQLEEDLEDLHEYESGVDDPKVLQKSLQIVAKNEALPEGLKEWFQSVDAIPQQELPKDSAKPEPTPRLDKQDNVRVLPNRALYPVPDLW